MAARQAIQVSSRLLSAAGAGVLVMILVAACTSGAARPGQSSPPGSSAGGPSGPAAPHASGLAIPLTYREACAEEAGFCAVNAAGQIPDVLRHRPLRLPVLHRGQRCPASRGHTIANPALIYGTALGTGPAQVVIEGAGDLTRGNADLLQSFTPSWRGTKTLWLIRPAYQGPVIIRAQRLDGNGVIDINSASDGPSLPPAPLIIPPGATPNDTGGWREAPAGTWVKSPGCYGWQIDGLAFTEVIVVKFVCAPQYQCPKDFGLTRKDP